MSESRKLYMKMPTLNVTSYFLRGNVNNHVKVVSSKLCGSNSAARRDTSCRPSPSKLILIFMVNIEVFHNFKIEAIMLIAFF